MGHSYQGLSAKRDNANRIRTGIDLWTCRVTIRFENITIAIDNLYLRLLRMKLMRTWMNLISESVHWDSSFDLINFHSNVWRRLALDRKGSSAKASKLRGSFFAWNRSKPISVRWPVSLPVVAVSQSTVLCVLEASVCRRVSKTEFNSTQSSLCYDLNLSSVIFCSFSSPMSAA